MQTAISENSLTILKARYLEGETVEDLWDRASLGNVEYRNMISTLHMLPNSPTLFNAGKNNGCTLSACFVFDVDDSMLDGPNSIMGTAAKAAAVAKAGGGVGYYFGKVRPKGDLIKSVHRKACGPVAVLKYYHQIRNLITQGGKRDLAQMGVLPCWHQDIREFIHVKDADPKALESFNISVSWTDEWMQKVDWDFLVHLDKETRLTESNEQTSIWGEQCRSAWQTGDPGMLFWDTINRRNATPHVGDINGTNPCGETPNINDEPCNLGSLSLRRFVKKDGKGKWSVDWDKLKHFARLATRYLDDILDANVFPHPGIDHMARHTRKLGLGVMGWANMLALLHIPYASTAAVDLAREVMKTINHEALMESQTLAIVKGVYPAYDPERSPKWAPAVRNSTRTSIAPTGTIAIIADDSSSIEPHYALENTRVTNEGIRMNEKIVVWDELDGFVPQVANEIPLEWHIRHQAAFQEFTDLGVSKTINLPKTATVQDVSNAYRMMWVLECKGGTIYRDGCREDQVLRAVTKKSVYSNGAELPNHSDQPVPVRRKLPKESDNTIRHKFNIDGVEGYLHVGRYDDGSPGEIFFRVSMSGSTVSGMLNAWAISFSNALQHGTPLKDLVRLHKGMRFEPNGMTGNKLIPTCTSIPDYTVRYLEMKFLGTSIPKLTKGANAEVKEAVADLASGHLCPDCGTMTIYQAGCLMCVKSGCGWSRCG